MSIPGLFRVISKVLLSFPYDIRYLFTLLKYDLNLFLPILIGFD